MNQQKAKIFLRDWLPLVQALADGKTIEFELCDDKGRRWVPVQGISMSLWKPSKYRVADSGTQK